MLKPAICYKEQIESALKEYFYSEDMLLYMGELRNGLIKVEENPRDGYFQYAVVDNVGNLIGYIAYTVDYYSSCAYNFGAFSFDRGNPIMGVELLKLMENLIGRFHRVEFRAISGNPAVKSYYRFVEKHNGRVHKLTDAFVDADGYPRDVYIYEILDEWW